MSVVSSSIMGGLLGLSFALACWRRKREIDKDGNLCLRYFGPKYAFPLVAANFAGIGFYHIDDPMYLANPENFFIIFGFATLTFIASLHFVLYRVTLTQNSIERIQWPFKPLRYSIDQLTLIGQKRGEAVLHFSGEDTFKINLLLSGQNEFIEKLQASMLSRPINSFCRPHNSRRK
jgi:hypothetical protein